MAVKSGIDKALRSIRNLPRIDLTNIRDLPQSTRKRHVRDRGQHGGGKGHGHKGQRQHGTLPPIGFEGGQTPFYIRMPYEPYYRHHQYRRELLPLSLLELQRTIDLGRLDTSKPIDVTSLCNTGLPNWKLFPNARQYGFRLTDDGADIFAAKINIEVQMADETTIAAVERNGGTITSRFYDIQSLHAKVDPPKFFKRGIPIPRCKLPPQVWLEYYTTAENRGYLADPELIRQARLELSQKYGYNLPDVSNDEQAEMLTIRKDPRQIFLGLKPGWLVNLEDRQILQSTDPEILEYYAS